MLKQNGSSRNWYMLLVIKVPKNWKAFNFVIAFWAFHFIWLKLGGISRNSWTKFTVRVPYWSKVLPKYLSLQGIWPFKIFDPLKYLSPSDLLPCDIRGAGRGEPKYLAQNIWTKIFVPETFVPKWFATLWRQGCWQGFCPHSLFFLQFWLITRGAGNEWG